MVDLKFFSSGVLCNEPAEFDTHEIHPVYMYCRALPTYALSMRSGCVQALQLL
jgi:hypothetical protein